MTAIRCDVVVGPGSRGRRWFDGEKLLHVLLENGAHIERRLHLGYSPPFLQLLPCPFCGVEEDRGHDPLKHVGTNLSVTLAP